MKCISYFHRHPSTRLILLYGIAAIFSAAAFARINFAGLINAQIDAQSHLLQSMQIIDSLTPGMSQIGFWPPLLHILLLPAVIALPYPVLMIAGAFITLLPLTLLGAYFLYGIAVRSGIAPRYAFLAPLLFILHPYVQYYAASAMSEVPYMVALFGAVYFALGWSSNLGLKDLFLFAVFVSLATLARYEGFALIPLSILFVISRCLSLRMSFDKVKALVITFSFIAVAGLVYIVIYSAVYAGGPLRFLSLGVEWVGGNEHDFVRSSISLHDAVNMLIVFYYASVHMDGIWMMFATSISVLILVLLRRSWNDVAVMLFLFSPALFVIVMMIIGRNAIQVAELPEFRSNEITPFGQFANIRYALTWVGAAIVSIVLAVDGIARIPFFTRLTRYVIVPIVVCSAVLWFIQVFFMHAFYVIRYDSSVPYHFRYEDQVPVNQEDDAIVRLYDGGRVLLPRYFGEGRMLAWAKIVPMEMYLFEGNYKHFEQAMREPWLFARWVIVRYATPGGQYFDENGVLQVNPPTTNIVERASVLRDFLSLERNPVFQQYYELVGVEQYTRTYRLRDHVLRDLVVERGFDPMLIPSLNPSAEWNPVEFYDTLSKSRR